MNDDDPKYEQMVGHVRTVAEAYLMKFFGERCPDFEQHCVVCQKWAALDKLLSS